MISACLLSVTMENSSQKFPITIIKSPWSDTALSTVGENAFHQIFSTHTRHLRSRNIPTIPEIEFYPLPWLASTITLHSSSDNTYLDINSPNSFHNDSPDDISVAKQILKCHRLEAWTFPYGQGTVAPPTIIITYSDFWHISDTTTAITTTVMIVHLVVILSSWTSSIFTR